MWFWPTSCVQDDRLPIARHFLLDLPAARHIVPQAHWAALEPLLSQPSPSPAAQPTPAPEAGTPASMPAAPSSSPPAPVPATAGAEEVSDPAAAGLHVGARGPGGYELTRSAGGQPQVQQKVSEGALLAVLNACARCPDVALAKEVGLLVSLDAALVAQAAAAYSSRVPCL